jgi:hypothetical protein
MNGSTLIQVSYRAQSQFNGKGSNWHALNGQRSGPNSVSYGFLDKDPAQTRKTQYFCRLHIVAPWRRSKSYPARTMERSNSLREEVQVQQSTRFPRDACLREQRFAVDFLFGSKLAEADTKRTKHPRLHRDVHRAAGKQNDVAGS